MKNILIVWACVIIILMGCKATKDNHAYARVISDPALAERTFRTLELSHPCIVDTTYKVGVDSVIRDTVQDYTSINAANKTIDSLLDKILNAHTDTAYIDIDSLREKLTNEIRKTIKPIVIHTSTTRVDTIKQVDNSKIVELTGDKNNLTGQNTQLTAQVNSLKKTNTHKSLWIGGLVLLILLGIYLRIKKVF